MPAEMTVQAPSQVILQLWVLMHAADLDDESLRKTEYALDMQPER